MRALQRRCGGAAAAAANMSGIVSCVCRGGGGVVGRCGVVGRVRRLRLCGARRAWLRLLLLLLLRLLLL